MTDKKKIHVVGFSGGKDSTALLLMMLEKNMPVDRIFFIDTTKEYDEVYKHIEKVQKYIEPLKIEIVKIDWDYWFFEHIRKRSIPKFEGKKGYSWPNAISRWCTALKIEATQCMIAYGEYNPRERKRPKKEDYKNVIEYHGINADEEERVGKNDGDGRTIKYPLVDWGITGQNALEYCYSKGFDWDGLYQKFPRMSCWCCPLQPMHVLKRLYTEYPEYWKQLREMDVDALKVFKHRYSVLDLEEKFDRELEKEKQKEREKNAQLGLDIG